MNTAAIKIIEQCGISPMDAALLIRQLFTQLCGRGNKLSRAMKCIDLGHRELARQEKTVPFHRAVEETLTSKQHRRPRTVAEIKYICTRLMKCCPELEQQPVRAILPEECFQYIFQTFPTSRQRYKARLILSGVFSTAQKRGWCSRNPAASGSMDIHPPSETPVRILSLPEIRRLNRAADTLHHGECLAAFSLMLYAGIRPTEVTRLTWDMVNLEDDVIYLPARHSKTGGARQVSILPVLHRVLVKVLQQGLCKGTERICPEHWQKKWKDIRAQAGWGVSGLPWIQDILRHCYASYHAKRFRNYTELQYEMGHSCLHLLKSRYLNMEGLSSRDAMHFWEDAS